MRFISDLVNVSSFTVKYKENNVLLFYEGNYKKCLKSTIMVACENPGNENTVKFAFLLEKYLYSYNLLEIYRQSLHIGSITNMLLT